MVTRLIEVCYENCSSTQSLLSVDRDVLAFKLFRLFCAGVWACANGYTWQDEPQVFAESRGDVEVTSVDEHKNLSQIRNNWMLCSQSEATPVTPSFQFSVPVVIRSIGLMCWSVTCA